MRRSPAKPTGTTSSYTGVSTSGQTTGLKSLAQAVQAPLASMLLHAIIEAKLCIYLMHCTGFALFKVASAVLGSTACFRFSKHVTYNMVLLTIFSYLTRHTLRRASEFIQGLSSGASKAGVFASPTAAAYWAYHLTRTGFLAVQGLAGNHHTPLSCSFIAWDTSRLQLALLRLFQHGCVGVVVTQCTP